MIPTLPKALVIVAHPDDEALFFFATIRRLKKAGIPVAVITATGQFRSAQDTRQRMEEFSRSCQALGVEAHSLGLLDRPDLPLNQAQLRARLLPFAANRAFACAYTHNPWGDYGHPHHASVSLAVSETFWRRVYFLAGPMKGDCGVRLSKREYRAKLRHVRTAYKTQIFAWTWCSGRESVVRLAPSTVRFLVRFSICSESQVRPEHEPELNPHLRSIALAYWRAFGEKAHRIPDELGHIPYSEWSERIKRSWERLQCYLGAERTTFVRGP